MKIRMNIRRMLALAVLCGLSARCFNPNLPTVVVVSPEPDTSVVADVLPLTQVVEVSVPLPGCGAAAFPVNPDTFTATLHGMLDGKVVLEEDVTPRFGSGEPDPATGAITWAGEVQLEALGEYEIVFSVENEHGPGSGLLRLRVQQPLPDFPGGWFVLSLSSLAQSPPGCMGPEILLDLIFPVIKDLVFPVTLPSAAEILESDNAYPLSLTINPMFPSIPLVLSLDEQANEIVMDGPDAFTYNLAGAFPASGLDCILTAAIDGAFEDIDPQDPDGRLTLDLTVEAAPGGECSLIPAGDACALILGLDGDVE